MKAGVGATISSGRRAVAITAGTLVGMAVGGAGADPGDSPGPAEREAFLLHCAGCHREDGQGDGRMIPDLTRLGLLLTREGARDYLVRVPGVAQAPLESASLARLLNYVVGQLAGVSDYPPFATEEVDALRRRPLRDPAAVRPSER